MDNELTLVQLYALHPQIQSGGGQVLVNRMEHMAIDSNERAEVVYQMEVMVLLAMAGVRLPKETSPMDSLLRFHVGSGHRAGRT